MKNTIRGAELRACQEMRRHGFLVRQSDIAVSLLLTISFFVEGPLPHLGVAIRLHPSTSSPNWLDGSPRAIQRRTKQAAETT